MTVLPLWAVYAVAFGTPLSALLGVLLTVWWTRRSARDLDARSTREELMRNLRWAAEMAADEDEIRRRVGIDQLAAWGRASLLETGDQIFVDAALASVVRDRTDEVKEIKSRNLEVAAVEPVEPVDVESGHSEAGGSDH